MVIAPSECEDHPKTKACFTKLVDEGHIHKVHYLDVRESMKNGGGPACLRLRVVLNPQERKAVLPTVWLNDSLYNALCGWIQAHYRDRITPDDLRDPALPAEADRGLSELSSMLKIQMEAA